MSRCAHGIAARPIVLAACRRTPQEDAGERACRPRCCPGLAFAMSATSESSSDAQLARAAASARTVSPTSLAALDAPARRASSSPMTADVAVAERDDAAAPVRVATSTIASGCSSLAATRPSASTSRPSASVLSTSTVVPPRIRSTSFGPDRRARRHVLGEAQPAGDPHRQPELARRATIDGEHGRGPVMSYFMPTIDAGGLEREAARVEGDALADEREVRGARRRGRSSSATSRGAAARARDRRRGCRRSRRPRARPRPSTCEVDARRVRGRPPRAAAKRLGVEVGRRRVHEVAHGATARGDDGAHAREARVVERRRAG